MKREERKLSSVLRGVWDLSAYMGKWTIVFLVCYQFWKREKILTIFKEINEFDEKVSCEFDFRSFDFWV
jgi:hypothetical protein